MCSCLRPCLTTRHGMPYVAVGMVGLRRLAAVEVCGAAVGGRGRGRGKVGRESLPKPAMPAHMTQKEKVVILKSSSTAACSAALGAC